MACRETGENFQSRKRRTVSAQLAGETDPGVGWCLFPSHRVFDLCSSEAPTFVGPRDTASSGGQSSCSWQKLGVVDLYPSRTLCCSPQAGLAGKRLISRFKGVLGARGPP